MKEMGPDHVRLAWFDLLGADGSSRTIETPDSQRFRHLVATLGAQSLD